jgi:hypothetical protein
VWKPSGTRTLEADPPVAQQSPVINPDGWFTVLGQGSASEHFSALTRGLGGESQIEVSPAAHLVVGASRLFVWYVTAAVRYPPTSDTPALMRHPGRASWLVRRLTDFRFIAFGDRRVGVVLPGNPLIDGGTEKPPVAAESEGGDLFAFEQPVNHALGTPEVIGEGRHGHDLLGLVVG